MGLPICTCSHGSPLSLPWVNTNSPIHYCEWSLRAQTAFKNLFHVLNKRKKEGDLDMDISKTCRLRPYGDPLHCDFKNVSMSWWACFQRLVLSNSFLCLFHKSNLHGKSDWQLWETSSYWQSDTSCMCEMSKKVHQQKGVVPYRNAWIKVLVCRSSV